MDTPIAPYSVFWEIQKEVENICYIERDEQINALIYCINIYYFEIDLDDPNNFDFVQTIKNKCNIALDNFKYPPAPGEEYEMSFIEEKLEVRTVELIEVILKEFNNFFM